MEPKNKDIIKLIEGCRRRDRASQKSLYQTYYSFSMGLCIRYANSKEEAQEIMNDAFMKVFKYIEKFDSSKPFKPWLKRILVNTAVDYFNKSKHHQQNVDIEPYLFKTIDNSTSEAISYHDMLTIIQQLPNAYRTVFNLRAIEGYKHEEIAKILGISVGTSKSNYARAKGKLQQFLITYFE